MTHQPYAPTQATYVFPFVDFEPAWLIDCGPGLGQEALRFKERWPGIKVIGFEPSRATFDLIVAEYPGTLVPAAVGAETGHAVMHKPDVVMGSSLVHAEPGQEGVQVYRLALDDVSNLVGCRDAVLWADVEGSELDVLRGARRLLAEGAIRLINVEVHEGEEEAAMDAACAELGFEQVLTYAGNGLHHDNVYRRLA